MVVTGREGAAERYQKAKAQEAREWRGSLLWKVPIGVALIAAVALVQLLPADATDEAVQMLLNDEVPATARVPSEHWAFIRGFRTFTRDMRRKLQQDKGSNEVNRKLLDQGFDLTEHIEGIDAGGEDAAPEDFDPSDPMSVTVSRCSSTQYAVTAYFCGAEVAGDHAGSKRRAREVSGNSAASQRQLLGDTDVESLRFLVGAWMDGVEKRRVRHVGEKTVSAKVRSAGANVSKRPRFTEDILVLRLGIGQKTRSTPALEHVWSVVGLPDGHWLWLQSYIGYYALSDWMDHSTRKGEATLSLKKLDAKLATLEKLIAETTGPWDEVANERYKELFFANINMGGSMLNGRADFHGSKHGFEFAWDLACGMPSLQAIVDDSAVPPPAAMPKTRTKAKTKTKTKAKTKTKTKK